MNLAANYSTATAGLLQAGLIHLDYFKCPAWPDVVARARQLLPVYVHLPLLAGWGRGDALDGEVGGVPDWGRIERLLVQTGTPYVNLHLAAEAAYWPGIPSDTADPAHVEMVTQALIRDVQAVCRRFGPERVVVENDNYFGGRHLRPGFLPKVIACVVSETGCGLLLDLAHAQLVAGEVGLSPRDYVAALPLAHLRELHVAGVQIVDDRWIERFEAVDPQFAHRFAHQPMDHLPMTAADWELVGWAAAQIHAGAWPAPWIVTFEFGGVGPLWELLGEREVLGQDIPRLHRLLKNRCRPGKSPAYGTNQSSRQVALEP